MRCNLISNTCIFLIYLMINCNAAVSGYLQVETNVKLNTKDLVSYVLSFAKLGGLIEMKKKASTNEILTELKTVHDSIDRIESMMQSQPQEIVNTLLLVTEMKSIRSHFIEYSNYINYQYKKLTFGLDSHRTSPLENVTLQELAEESTGHGIHNLPHFVNQFVQLINPTGNSNYGLVDLYSQYAMGKTEKGEWCDNTQSLNEFIYQTYRYSLGVITKGYIVILTSYAIRRSFNEGNFEVEAKFTTEEYYAAVNGVANKLHTLASGASVSLRRCDPEKHERGKTYLEFTRLIQGFVVHEYALNKEHSGKNNCEDYLDTKYYDFPEFNSTGNWKCYGRIYNCFTSFTTYICPASNPSRRFNGFLAKNSKDSSYGEIVAKPMGNTTSCHNNQGTDFNDVAPSNYFSTYRIDPCACYCDDTNHPDTLRKFSIYPATSDYFDNMVVTGFRFVNDNNTVYIEIQQGKLQQYGYINESTVGWRNRDEYISQDVMESGHLSRQQLSWDYRSINLNPVKAQPDQAIIGVMVMTNPHKSVLELWAWVVNINYTTGELLNINDDNWISPDTPTDKLEIDRPTIPTLAFKNTPNTELNKFIELQPSDWEKDAAQTVVPFLDIQEVVTNPPTLLSGLRLYYRSSPGYGGFLGLEIYSFNYTNYIPSGALIRN